MTKKEYYLSALASHEEINCCKKKLEKMADWAYKEKNEHVHREIFCI